MATKSRARKNADEMVVFGTKRQAEQFKKKGKYSDKSKYSQRLTRQHNKKIPGSKPFYVIWVFRK